MRHVVTVKRRALAANEDRAQTLRGELRELDAGDGKAPAGQPG